MDTTTAICKAFLADESGVTAIEYGLLAGLIFIGLIAGTAIYAEGLTELYGKVSDLVTAAAAGL